MDIKCYDKNDVELQVGDLVKVPNHLSTFKVWKLHERNLIHVHDVEEDWEDHQFISKADQCTKV